VLNFLDEINIATIVTPWSEKKQKDSLVMLVSNLELFPNF
jgi:hypothetical protein